MAPRGSKSKDAPQRPGSNPRSTRRNAAVPPDIPLPPSRKPPTRRSKKTVHADEHDDGDPDATSQQPKTKPVPKV